jgi:hypothetical protein
MLTRHKTGKNLGIHCYVSRVLGIVIANVGRRCLQCAGHAVDHLVESEG